MNKHRYGHPGGILHALIHTLGTFGIVYLYFSWYVGVFFALIDGFIHYHIDWVRANINFYYDLSPNKAIFWILLGFDQLLHQLTYLGIVVTLFIFC